MPMTDTTGELENRYRTMVGVYGEWGVYDQELHCYIEGEFPTWAAAHCEAQRLNREARAANEPAAEQPAPCCDCAAKLKVAEEEAESYRHAMEQIWRYCSGAARRYADRALFTDAREGGEAMVNEKLEFSAQDMGRLARYLCRGRGTVRWLRDHSPNNEKEERIIDLMLQGYDEAAREEVSDG